MNIKEVLDKHLKWLNNEDGGSRANLSEADLRWADLSEANLSEADLRWANLSEANLSRANLRGANLSEANLSRADLSEANLSEANLRGANLRWANLSEANLSEANLRGANLSRANLSEADLSEANLRGADLRWADLSEANLRWADLSEADLRGANNIDKIFWDIQTAFYPLQCPEKGEYTAFKKANGLIVELRIPADAKRSSATSRKCRASKAVVVNITDCNGNTAGNETVSNYDRNFIYKIGETVEVSNFDENRWNECAPGIHHYMTFAEAVKHY